MKRWINVLNVYGKLDRSYLFKDYDALGRYIKYEKNKRLAAMAKDCRDYTLLDTFSIEILIEKIKCLITTIEKFHKEEEKESVDQINTKFVSRRQSSRHLDSTPKIYFEQLHFSKEETLRSFDITISSPSASRKVRRIVEKRVCQAYHRQHHSHERSVSNCRRYCMKRAVSYQLHDLGQIDEVTHRRTGTHWKRSIDSITGQVVLKPKQNYSTMEKAVMAAQKYNKRFPNEKLPMEAYKCVHCNKYHIGHNYAIACRFTTA